MNEEQNHKDIVSLREHLEKLFEQYRDSHAREHELQADSIELARKNMEYRLEGLNEWRAQLTAERTGLVSLDKFEGKADAIDAAINGLTLSVAELKLLEGIARSALSSASSAEKIAERSRGAATKALIGVSIAAAASILAAVVAVAL